MDPSQESVYKNAGTMLVINPTGKILQLFVPIKAVFKHAVKGIPVGTTVFIEGIMLHQEYKMCYRITGKWYVYFCFMIVRQR